jgi:hypothetical protein
VHSHIGLINTLLARSERIVCDPLVVPQTRRAIGAFIRSVTDCASPLAISEMRVGVSQLVDRGSSWSGSIRLAVSKFSCTKSPCTLESARPVTTAPAYGSWQSGRGLQAVLLPCQVSKTVRSDKPP